MMNRPKRIQKIMLNWTFIVILVSISMVIPNTGTGTARANLDDANQFGPSNYIPMLHNNYCSGTRASTNKIGTQIYGGTHYGRSDFNLLQDIQSTWIRDSIIWPQIEPTNRHPSKFSWAWSDYVLFTAVATCANLIVTIEDTPDWAKLTVSVRQSKQRT